jgi:SWI/SNF-related matrix-associated actin-dependent regulator of chromatin subfamily A-like protein 1
MSGTVTLENERFRFDIEWDPALVRAIRAIPGRRIEGKHWTAPAQFAGQVLQIADLHGLEYFGPAPAAKAPATISHRPGVFEVRFDYSDQSLVTAVAAIPGSSWFQPAECWLVPDRHGVAVNLWAEEASATVDDKAEDAIAYAYDAEVRYVASAAKTTEWQLTRPGFGLELYDEQRAGVEYVLLHGKGRTIIGDEPGVGKTAQALGIIHELHALPGVIIVPASLKVNWRREAKRALPYASVEIIRGTRPQPRLLWADIVIINYDILPHWVDNLPDVPMAVVADESHWIKNPAISRTKAAIALAERVPDGRGARLALSGTPLPNRTNEIMTQLEFIGQINKFGGKVTARKKWKTRGAELNRELRSTCYIRRLKKDVWKEAPGRNWAELYVEGDPAVMVQYRAAEADIVTYLGEQARKAAIESGATSHEGKQAAWQASLRANAAEHLVAITHLKQLAAQAAMPACKEWARTFLDSGEKLGIFAWHTAVVNDLANTLNGVKVQGGMSESARQQSVDLFQNKPEVKVFVGQMKAAGEGLTLTAASNCLLIEQGWNQSTHDQVLDRFHRRGQVNDCMGYVVLIEGTITEDIQKLIKRKQKEVDAVVDGAGGAEGGTVLQDLVVLLAGRNKDLQ